MRHVRFNPGRFAGRAPRLVLPDDWPDELYPLRKDSMDYRQRPAPTTDAETYEFINEPVTRKITWCRLARCVT